MHPRQESSETTPPMITRDSKFKTNLATIAAIIAAAWLASAYVNNNKRDEADLTRTVDDHTRQLTTLQSSVGSLNDQVKTITANQEAQTKLLWFLAKGGKGPLPEQTK